MNISDLNGKRLALHIIEGSEEIHHRVVTRSVSVSNQNVTIHDEESEKQFTLPPEWLARIRPVPFEFTDVFDEAEYVLPLESEGLPDSTSIGFELIPGLRLPTPNC